jgi:signal transduction histidine kinase
MGEKNEKTIAEISEENDFLGELIATTAHSLRTSLSATKWVIQMFLDRDFGDLSIEQESMLNKTAESNERMISVVNDMISVNQTMQYKEVVEKSEIDIVKMLESVIFDFSAESFKYEIQIIFIKPEKPCFIKSDADKVRLIFSNLVENAIKYSSANDKIFINIKDNEGYYTFSIKDTGIGIPDKEQAHIFEKFYRATNAVTKEPTGSGIGLYTVKKSLDLLGGSIDFESSPIGTNFNVTLKK